MNFLDLVDYLWPWLLLHGRGIVLGLVMSACLILNPMPRPEDCKASCCVAAARRAELAATEQISRLEAENRKSKSLIETLEVNVKALEKKAKALEITAEANNVPQTLAEWRTKALQQLDVRCRTSVAKYAETKDTIDAWKAAARNVKALQEKDDKMSEMIQPLELKNKKLTEEKEDLHHQVKYLNEFVDESKREEEYLRRSLSTAMVRNEVVVEENSHLHKLVVKAEQENMIFQQNIASIKSEAGSLGTQLARVSAKYIELKGERAQWYADSWKQLEVAAENNELREDVRRLKSEFRAKDSECVIWTSEAKRLEQEVGELLKTMKELKADQQDEISILETEKGKVEKQLLNIHSAHIDLLMENDEKEYDLQTIAGSLCQSEMANERSRCAIKELEARPQDLDREWKACEEKWQAALAKEKSLTAEAHRRCAQLTGQCRELAEKCKRWENKCEKLRVGGEGVVIQRVEGAEDRSANLETKDQWQQVEIVV